MFSERKTIDELDSSTKHVIDDLYRGILNRPADIQGLQNYGTMLENVELTIEEIEEYIYNSEESLSIRLSTHKTKS